MTIKKLWLIILIFISIISIGTNALILTSLTNRYFRAYLSENYDKHLQQVIEYAKSALLEKDISFKQMKLELETHLNDPIIEIKLYSKEGDLLVNVNSSSHFTNNMMNRRSMRNNSSKESGEIEQYRILNNGNLLGILHISKSNSIHNSLVAWDFKTSLIHNSVFSMLITIIISIIIGIFVSKKISKELIETKNLANDIQTGVDNRPKKSFIIEINEIRNSLNELNIRLKIKQKNRKELIDQLMHQTRTPLTILKSHLEGIEDGLIEINAEEIIIWQNQISDINTIIANMSGMIDANKENNEVSINEFEINHLIQQIIKGLKPQFNKKSINLTLLTNEKIYMKTDKYKLSQIIYNLLTNAYKYTETNKKVEVSYETNENFIFIKVKDLGIGIDPSEISIIFNAYYRSNSISHLSGEGIGLYIVKENLNLINGSIRVESKLGFGSSFLIEVPLCLERN